MPELPERPLLIYPSLAESLGVEGALLFGYIAEIERIKGNPFTLDEHLILADLPFWSVAKFEQLALQLSSRGLLQIERSAENTYRIQLIKTAEIASVPVSEPQVTQLPVVDYSAPKTSQRGGPAPTFGGHSGWRRSPSELDEIFAAAEQRKKQLREMSLDWRPTRIFFELIERSPITPAFAETCRDEFIAYYVEKGDRHANWDQRFLAWVKRAWRDEESSRARADKYNEPSQAGSSHEKSRPDTRENRKRVTAAIMDLKDIDW